MATQKLEYECKLDSHVQTFRYAASALQEMRQLLTAIENPTSTKLIFQTLPKHMRRRAMSHHPKRLPRKYRAGHCSQMAKAGKPQSTKRPSRKYRRRACNLLREYLRRQRRNVWLETHIWHARRFHMIERWGYRLPYASCDKTYRACYRATAQHCLVQDISFYACVQLCGKLAHLRAGFARLSSAECGLGIAARTFLSGRREGCIELFKADQYPAGALGKANFMWRPLTAMEAAAQSTSVDELERTLWLWLHPAAYLVVLEELIKVFELVSLKSITVQLQPNEVNALSAAEDNSNDKKSTEKLKAKEQQRLQFMTKTFAYERIKRYANSETAVELSELKDTMNRFRLTGPLSQAVLSNAFKTKTTSLPVADNQMKHWFHTRLGSDSSFQTSHNTQAQYWQQCQQLNTPAALLSNLVLALNIDDPRVHRPPKRTKAQPSLVADPAIAQDALINTPTCLPESALWDAQLRDHICEKMTSTHAYCDLRSKQALIPGAACQFERDLQPVPVLLIQRPGSQQPQNKRLNYACGWDVIVPAGYGMPVWQSLIMWGAKPGGLRECDSVAREMGTEQHLPDTVGGQQTAAARYAELRAKYFRRPQNKRCSYRKFAIVSPFRVPYVELVRDWLPAACPTTTNVANPTKFFILRNRMLLQQLNACIQRRSSAFPAEISNQCLIQLQLRMKARGNPADYALVCLPTRADFKRNLKQLRGENNEPVYTEPLLSDPNEKERLQLRRQHKRLLKRLRARRVREKRKLQETAVKRVYIRPAGTAQIVAAQFQKMCALWLPEDYQTLFSVRKQCTREVFGYVASANFSYIEATVCAVAYVTVEGLKQLLDSCKSSRVRQPMCLVRSTQSRHYRFATFQLNLQV